MSTLERRGPLHESLGGSPTPAHEKERQANQYCVRGREEKEAKDDPDTEQRHPQRRLHGNLFG